MMMTSLWRHL